MELKLYAEVKMYAVTALLIVPYGIETGADLTFGEFRNAFNRTLWN